MPSRSSLCPARPTYRPSHHLSQSTSFKVKEEITSGGLLSLPHNSHKHCSVERNIWRILVQSSQLFGTNFINQHYVQHSREEGHNDPIDYSPHYHYHHYCHHFHNNFSSSPPSGQGGRTLSRLRKVYWRKLKSNRGG